MWTYSGDPSTSEKDEYRFYIQDTNSEEPLLQDEEINFILTKFADKNRRMYELLDIICNKFTVDGGSITIGPFKEDMDTKSERYKVLLDKYKAAVFSGISQPRYAYPKVFSKGMHNNVQ